MSELDIKVTGDNTEAIQSIKDTIALLKHAQVPLASLCQWREH